MIDLKKFEEFVSRGKPLPEAYVVTVSRGKKFGLNGKIVVEINKTKSQYAKIFFERERRIVAIQFIVKPEKSCFRIQMGKGKNFAWITGWSFCNFYKIDCSKTRSYKAEYDEAENIVFFTLTNPLREQ